MNLDTMIIATRKVTIK